MALCYITGLVDCVIDYYLETPQHILLLTLAHTHTHTHSLTDPLSPPVTPYLQGVDCTQAFLTSSGAVGVFLCSL